PNPVSDRLGISGITENAVVTVLDASGKTVLQSTVAPNETIAVNRLQNGIYFVVVNGKTMKMIKKGNK
ncbi:MAG: T9SS type A sorting domain-containing protein, partial [Candidatus Azobacteroides sp.]|nr:T9SS type A sorting domain-containing protein [Candidatus Azobacteroides sp.]